MSLVARAGIVAFAMTITTVGCDSVFRFDQPASATDGGPTDEGGDGGAPRPCTDDTTCGGLRCQVSTGTCVACNADTDCSGARRRCETTLGICVECTATTDCPERLSCNPQTGRCVDACDDSDDPCPLAGFTCDGKLKLCVECRESENCTAPSRPVCDIPIGRCVECTGNAQCASVKPICDRRSGRCEVCVTSAECGVGSVCDPATLTCRQLL